MYNRKTFIGVIINLVFMQTILVHKIYQKWYYMKVINITCEGYFFKWSTGQINCYKNLNKTKACLQLLSYI